MSPLPSRKWLRSRQRLLSRRAHARRQLGLELLENRWLLAGDLNSLEIANLEYRPDSKAVLQTVGSHANPRVALAQGTVAQAQSSPSPAAVYVDDDFVILAPGTLIADADPNTVGDQGAILGIDAFATIQEGVNAVAGFGSVFVIDGLYTESVSIAKSLTLRGTGRRDLAVVDPPSGGLSNGITLTAGADSVTIGQLRITDATGNGIAAIGISHLTLDDIEVDGHGADGFHGESIAGRLHVINSTFGLNAGAGAAVVNSPLVDLDFEVVVSALNSRGLVQRQVNSFTDLDGNYSNNADDGVFLEDIATTVVLTRTTLNDNDGDADGIGDGLFAHDGEDADFLAIGGNVRLYGLTARDTDAQAVAKHQRTGIIIHGVGGSTLIDDVPSGALPFRTTTVDGNEDVGVSLELTSGDVEVRSAQVFGNVASNLVVARSAGKVSVIGGFFNASSAGSGLNVVSTTQNVLLDGVIANDNYLSGIDVVAAGAVTFSDVVALSNHAAGAKLESIANLVDIGGVFRGNSVHGIQVVDAAEGVALVRTVLEDNASLTGETGDGFNATDGPDADNDAIAGNLTVSGARIRATGLITDHSQHRGVYVSKLGGNLLLNETDSIANTVSGNMSSGVLVYGGTTAEALRGLYESNALATGGAGLELREFSGLVATNQVAVTGNRVGVLVDTVGAYRDTDSVLRDSMVRGLELRDIQGNVLLTRTALLDNTGEGLLAVDGTDVGNSDAIIGSLMLNGVRIENQTTTATGQQTGVKIDGVGVSVIVADAASPFASSVISGHTGIGLDVVRVGSAASLGSGVVSFVNSTITANQIGFRTEAAVQQALANVTMSGNALGSGMARVGTLSLESGDDADYVRIDGSSLNHSRNAVAQNEVAFTSGTINVNVSTGQGTDTVELILARPMAFNLLGGDPTSNPRGDTLNIDASGNPLTITSTLGATLGGNGSQLQFSQFENHQIANALLEMEGSDRDDRLEVIASSADSGTAQLITDFRLNPVVGPLLTLTNLSGLTFTAGLGMDQLHVTNPVATVFQPAVGTTLDAEELELVGGQADEVVHQFSNPLADYPQGPLSINGREAYRTTATTLATKLKEGSATKRRAFAFETRAVNVPVLAFGIADDGVEGNGYSALLQSSTRNHFEPKLVDKLFEYADPSEELLVEYTTNSSTGGSRERFYLLELDSKFDADVRVVGVNDTNFHVGPIYDATTAKNLDLGTGSLTITANSIQVNTNLKTDGGSIQVFGVGTDSKYLMDSERISQSARISATGSGTVTVEVDEFVMFDPTSIEAGTGDISLTTRKGFLGVGRLTTTGNLTLRSAADIQNSSVPGSVLIADSAYLFAPNGFVFPFAMPSFFNQVEGIAGFDFRIHNQNDLTIGIPGGVEGILAGNDIAIDATFGSDPTEEIRIQVSENIVTSRLLGLEAPHLFVDRGVTVNAGGIVSLSATESIQIASTSVVKGYVVDINLDAYNSVAADTMLLLSGTVIATGPGAVPEIRGGDDIDRITIQPSPTDHIPALEIDGVRNADVFKFHLQPGTLAADFKVTGGSAAAKMIIDGSAAAEQFSIVSGGNYETIDVAFATPAGMGTQHFDIALIPNIEIHGNDGGDRVHLAPQRSQTLYSITGGSPTSSPGDTLIVDAKGRRVSFSPGALQVDQEFYPINYSQFENVRIDNLQELNLFGSPADDEFEISVGTPGLTRIQARLPISDGDGGTVPGSWHTTAIEILSDTNVFIDGGGGNDRIRFVGTEQSDALNIHPEASTFNSQNFGLAGFHHLSASLAGGDDAITITSHWMNMSIDGGAGRDALTYFGAYAAGPVGIDLNLRILGDTVGATQHSAFESIEVHPGDAGDGTRRAEVHNLPTGSLTYTPLGPQRALLTNSSQIGVLINHDHRGIAEEYLLEDATSVLINNDHRAGLPTDLQIQGSIEADHFLLAGNTVQVLGKLPAQISNPQQFKFLGHEGDDTLQIDVDGGRGFDLIATPIYFDGGDGGFDTLELIGDPTTAVETAIYRPGPDTHNGSLEFEDAMQQRLMLVEFSGLEPVKNLVGGFNFHQVYGTDRSDTISYRSIDVGGLAFGRVSVNDMETYSFQTENVTQVPALALVGERGNDQFEVEIPYRPGVDTLRGLDIYGAESILDQSEPNSLILHGSVRDDEIEYKAGFGDIPLVNLLYSQKGFSPRNVMRLNNISDIVVPRSGGFDALEIVGTHRNEQLVLEPLAPRTHGNYLSDAFPSTNAFLSQTDHRLPNGETTFAAYGFKNVVASLAGGQDSVEVRGSTADDRIVVDTSLGAFGIVESMVTIGVADPVRVLDHNILRVVALDGNDRIEIVNPLLSHISVDGGQGGRDTLVVTGEAAYVDFIPFEEPRSGRMTRQSRQTGDSVAIDYAGIDTLEARFEYSDPVIFIHADDGDNEISISSDPVVNIDDRTELQLLKLGNDAKLLVYGHKGSDRFATTLNNFDIHLDSGRTAAHDSVIYYAGVDAQYRPDATFNNGRAQLTLGDFDEIIVEAETLLAISNDQSPKVGFRMTGSTDPQAKAVALVVPREDTPIPIVGLYGSDHETLLSDPEHPSATNGGVLFVNSGLEPHDNIYLDVSSSDGQAVPQFELFAALIEPGEFFDIPSGGQIAVDIDHNRRVAGRGAVPLGGNGLISVDIDHNQRIAAIVNNDPTGSGVRTHSVLEILDAAGETVLATGSNIPGATGNGLVTAALPAGSYLVRVANNNPVGEGQYELVVFVIDDLSVVSASDGLSLINGSLEPGQHGRGSIVATPSFDDTVTLTPLGNRQSILQYNNATPLTLQDVANVEIDPQGGPDLLRVIGSPNSDRLLLSRNELVMNGQRFVQTNVESFVLLMGGGDDLVGVAQTLTVAGSLHVDGADGEDRFAMQLDGPNAELMLPGVLHDSRLVTSVAVESFSLKGMDDGFGNATNILVMGAADAIGSVSVIPQSVDELNIRSGTFSADLTTEGSITVSSATAPLASPRPIQHVEIQGTVLDETINVTDREVSFAGSVKSIGLSNIPSVAIAGGSGRDDFHVEMSPTTAFFIDGNNPIGLGDRLEVVSSIAPIFYPGPQNDEGAYATSGRQPVSFDHIEEHLASVVLNDFVFQLLGSHLTPTVSRIGSNVVIIDQSDGGILASYPLAQMNSLKIAGSTSNDDVTLLYNTDLFVIPGGIEFDGGVGSHDRLIVFGSGITQAEHSMSVNPLGSEQLQLSDSGRVSVIRYSNVEDRSYSNLETFEARSVLSIGSGSLELDTSTPIRLRSLTTLAGGTLSSINKIVLGAGVTLTGSGRVEGQFTGETGSAIRATGPLTIGDAASPSGFATRGELFSGANTVNLLDSNQAVLGGLTTLGDAGSAGNIVASNGLLVDFGQNVTGFGTLDTPNDPFKQLMHNGAIAGNSASQRITLSGFVKGVGSLTHVQIAGTYSPGFSPSVIYNGSVEYAAEGTTVIEIGGQIPGSSGFDQLNHSGVAVLSGILDVRLIDGFSVNVGDSFTILTANEGVLGQFDQLLLPAAPLGSDWAFRVEPHEVRIELVDLVNVFKIQVDDGSDQRSRVAKIEITFDGQVDIGADAFTLHKRGAEGGTVATSFTTQIVGENLVATLTFSGDFTRGSQHLLMDGNYQLTINASAVRRAGTSVALDGDDDGRQGGNRVLGTAEADAFYAFYGDVRGTRAVGAHEFSRFRQTLGKQDGDPEYDELFDFNGDSAVGALEFSHFRRNFGKFLIWQ